MAKQLTVNIINGHTEQEREDFKKIIQKARGSYRGRASLHN
jgi:hypothetical protein